MNNIERTIPRLKDLFTVMNKDAYVKIFHNDNEIDYNIAVNYKDFYVSNIETCFEDDDPAIRIDIQQTAELIYIPNFLL